MLVAQWGRAYVEALQTSCIKAFPHAEITGSCTGAETLATLRARPTDLLLLTLNFSDMDGLDVLRAVTEEHLAKRVLLGCRRRDEHCLYSLRNARFDGIVDTLDESIETLVAALQVVASGKTYLSPTFRAIMVDRIAPSKIWQQLTPGEVRVLAIIGDGSDDQEAATRLKLSTATVQTHRRNIMRKLNVSTSAKLVRESVRLGFIRITDDGDVIRPSFVIDGDASTVEILPTGST